MSFCFETVKFSASVCRKCTTEDRMACVENGLFKIHVCKSVICNFSPRPDCADTSTLKHISADIEDSAA